MDALLEFVNGSGWIIGIVLIFAAAIIVKSVLYFVYKHLLRRFKKTGNAWDDSILQAAYRPLLLSIWIIASLLALQVSLSGTGHKEWFTYLISMRETAVLLIFVWFLLRLINALEVNLIRPTPSREAYDPTTVSAIAKLVRLIVGVFAILSILQMFGVPLTGLIAAGGVGGLGITLAAKDLLANFFGGLMIYLDRPFKVGDWVTSPDRKIEGTVESIGWRLTRIRNFNKRPVYVPNSLFPNIILENAARMTNRRINTMVGVRYSDAAKIASIVKDVEAMLETEDGIDQSQTILVNFCEFGPSSLNFMVSAFTETTARSEFLLIQQKVFLKILEIIAEHGADCAFPTTTIHVPDGIKVQK